MAFDLTRVRGLCFDVDGTLSDTDDQWVNRLQFGLHAVRFVFKDQNPATFCRWLVMTSESPANALYHLLDHLSLDATFAALYERLIRARRNQKRTFLLMDHALELLEAVSQRYPCSIVSARDEASTLLFMRQFELKRHFRAVITSQTCEHTKPFADPVKRAAAMMRVTPQECVMIGDTTVDILAGKAAGAQTIGLLCGFGSEKELRNAGADLVVKDLTELMQVLGG